jgi:peptidoglycan/LPS O-acetylase OafA/YrhL
MRTDHAHQPVGLEDRLNSRANQFNLVRLLLALLVCFDHAGLVVTGQMKTEPLQLFGLSSGYLAVNGFFILSGILIAKSLSERGVSRSYFVSRFLRLYPALIVLALIAVFFIGPLVSKGSYWTGTGSLSYAFEVIRFGDTSGGPIGFYPDNPFPNEFDSPLWTLRYEMLCYLAAPLLVLSGLQKRPYWLAGSIAVLGFGVALAPPSSTQLFGQEILSSMLRFAFCFGLGMLAWAARQHVHGQLSWVVLTTICYIVAGVTGIGIDMAGTLWIGAITLFLGLKLPAKRPLKTDLSYGLYIWHFPVMQIIIGEAGIMPWQQLWIIAVPLALGLAWLSWTVIERPALKLKRYAKPQSATA